MKQARHQFLIETEKEKEGYNKTVKSLLVACDKDSSLNKRNSWGFSKLNFS